MGRHGAASGPVVLLSQVAAHRGVPGVHLKEVIGHLLDSRGDVEVLLRGGGEVSDLNAGVELLEEGQGDGGDIEAPKLVPAVNGVVQLLGGGEGGQVPGVAVVVDVLLVATESDTTVGGDVGVDGVDVAERVDDGLVVGESDVRAGLVGAGFAGGLGIEAVDGAEDGVRIQSTAAGNVEVGDEV